jgi:hypothetical protein
MNLPMLIFDVSGRDGRFDEHYLKIWWRFLWKMYRRTHPDDKASQKVYVDVTKCIHRVLVPAECPMATVRRSWR